MLDTSLVPFLKMNLKWIVEQHIKCKITKTA
jgi:hypothetical protein